MTRSGLRGWESTQRQTALGAVESEQRVRLVRPVVDGSVDGAQRLGSAYWREVERFTFGLVRSRQGVDGVELRLLGRRPLLLAFGQPVTDPHRGVSALLLPDHRWPARPPTRWRDRLRPGPGRRPAVVALHHHGLLPGAGRPAGRARLDRRALQPGAAAHPPGHQPTILQPPDRRGGPVRVVVFGASGTIGRALLPALDREHEVVAVSRRPRAAQSERTHWAVADASDPASVRRVLEGTQVVYYLVHSLDSPDFEERDRQAAEIVAREAERAGVAQIIYLGGLGDDAPGLSPHLRSRIETGRRLASGAVPVTVLRAAMVIGPGSAAFETIVALVDRLPGMVTPRWVSTPTQPIALVDVVRYLAGLCGLEKAFGASFDAGGPEVMTYREMIERIARLRGRHPLIVEVPVLSPRLSSYWLHLVTPVNAQMARPLIEGLRNPTVARDDRIRELLPFPLTSFEEAARAALRTRG